MRLNGQWREGLSFVGGCDTARFVMTTKRSTGPMKKAPAASATRKAAAAPKKVAAVPVTKETAAAVSKKKPVEKKVPSTKPAKVSLGPLTPVRQWPLVDDISVEDDIRFNAWWDAVPVHIKGTNPDWLARVGAGAFREGDYAQALALWSQIPDSYKLAEAVKMWRALALVRGIELVDEALRRRILEQALALVSASSHLAGEILCALGRVDEGLAVIDALREEYPQTEWRLLRQVLWLVRTGKPADAGKRIDKRLELITRFEEELRVEALFAWAAAGKPKQALAHVDALNVALSGLVRYVQGRKAVCPLPQGLEVLANDPRLAAWNVFFLDAEAAAEAIKSLETGPNAPMGVLPGPAMWEALRDGADYKIVAEVLLRCSRTAYMGASRGWLLIHPDKPGRIWLCLNGKIPAFLWPEANADFDGIVSLVAPYRRQLANDDPRGYHLTHSLRRYIGYGAGVPSPYSGELEELGFHTFSRVATMSPFLESYGWGSAHIEDPHRNFVDRGRMDGLLALRRTSGMDEQRVMSESYRTMHSRSILTLEHHTSGFLIEFNYRPNPHPGAVAAINARFKTSFPEDLPLDCVGLLMHFEGAPSADDLMKAITPELPQDQWWKLHAIAALIHGSLKFDEWLTSLPEVFAQEAIALAWNYGRLGFLLERAVNKPDLRQPIQGGPFVSALVPEGAEGSDDEEDDEDDEDES